MLRDTELFTGPNVRTIFSVAGNVRCITVRNSSRIILVILILFFFSRIFWEIHFELTKTEKIRTSAFMTHLGSLCLEGWNTRTSSSSGSGESRCQTQLENGGKCVKKTVRNNSLHNHTNKMLAQNFSKSCAETALIYA